MRNAVIASTGSYLPETIIKNEDLDQFPPGAIKKIGEKTGVYARRNAAPDQTTSDLAFEAARACLEKSGRAIDTIDGIIVSTSTPDRIQPATATRVQDMLGARRAFAFDINSVCAGSVYGISIADSMIRSGRHGPILFVAAETYSRILNRKDFSTYPYFGDGSGAILFEPADSAERGVLHSILHTDGAGCEIISVPAGGAMMPYDRMDNPKSAYFRMDGKTVFAFAIMRGTEVILELLKEARLMPGDVDLYVSHQANVNIIRKIAGMLEVPFEKFFLNLDRYGNTASASVPIALDEVLSQGLAKEGDLVVTVAFGGGLSWGANLIRI